MRKRVAQNEVFYHIVITDLGQVAVSWRVEKGDRVSDELFKTGNYFATKAEAERKVKEMEVTLLK